MEIRLNLVLLAALGATWMALTASEPVAAMNPADPDRRALAELEDRFAHDRGDIVLAQRLSRRYLEVDRPGLALAVLRAADPEILDDPMISHRLAQAYEKTGRMLDALATADLALARCGRSLGASGASASTPLPRYGCSERQYAVLDTHRSALDHMVRWGVSDPHRDSRTTVAYDLALRRARIARAP